MAIIDKRVNYVEEKADTTVSGIKENVERVNSLAERVRDNAKRAKDDLMHTLDKIETMVMMQPESATKDEVRLSAREEGRKAIDEARAFTIQKCNEVGLDME